MTSSSSPGSPSLEPTATILVTGGLGFIGSAVIRRLLAKSDHKVVNLDKHSYASTEGSARDWLHVEDHAAVLLAVLAHGAASRTYAIGGDSEVSNLEIVGQICDLVDAASGDQGWRSLIEFVTDRPGHDLRYGVDASRIKAELGWAPTHSFGSGLAATVDWFLANEDWWGPLLGESGDGARRGLQEACS